MGEWVIIANNNSKYFTEILVSDTIMAKTDAEIDAALSSEELAPGTVIFNAAETIKKRKTFDGSWVTVYDTSN